MKKKRGKKIYIIIGIAAALAVILFFPLRRVYRKTLPRKKNGIKQLEFAAGQRLTGYDVRDESGKWIDVSKISDGDAAVVAFNLKGCPDCKEDAFSQQILMNLYQTPDFNFYRGNMNTITTVYLPVGVVVYEVHRNSVGIALIANNGKHSPLCKVEYVKALPFGDCLLMSSHVSEHIISSFILRIYR